MTSDSGDTRSFRVQATMAAYPPPKLAEPLPCPRCHSTNTKFCYYNNYNLAQPRHFCKSCRRYWTHGGTLRNVPVGGGTRKSSASSKRSRSSSISVSTPSSSTLTLTQEPEPVPPMVSTCPLAVQTEAGLTEPTHLRESTVISENGSFASLSTGQSDGSFLALGGSGNGFGLGFGYGFGYGLDEMGLEFGGYHSGSVAAFPVTNAAASERDTWQHMAGHEGDSGGDSMVWPGIEISMPAKNMN